jgi:hypothetical protein
MNVKETVIKIIRDMSTELDGVSFDVTRVLMIAGTLVLFGCEFYGLYKGQPFSPTEYAIGLTTILAGGSAGIKLKETIERDKN